MTLGPFPVTSPTMAVETPRREFQRPASAVPVELRPMTIIVRPPADPPPRSTSTVQPSPCRGCFR